MHKYIKKQARLKQLSQGESQQQLGPRQPWKIIRIACERGENIAQERVGKLLEEVDSTEQKQKIVYELLMYRKVKLVENFVNRKRISKAQVIDSNQQIQALYDNFVNGTGTKKTSEKQVRKVQDEIQNEATSQKDRILQQIKSKIHLFKKVNPKYYALVVGLIVAAILAKKYRAKIIRVLKVVLNV